MGPPPTPSFSSSFSLPPTPPFSPTTHAYHALERVLSLDLDASQGWDQYEPDSDEEEMLSQHQHHHHTHQPPIAVTRTGKETEAGEESWREKGTGGTGKLRVVIVTGEWNVS